MVTKEENRVVVINYFANSYRNHILNLKMSFTDGLKMRLVIKLPFHDLLSHCFFLQTGDGKSYDYFYHSSPSPVRGISKSLDKHLIHF